MTIDKGSITSLADRAIYLVLDFSHLGVWRGVETQDTNNDVRASKRIIKSKAVDDMRKLNYRVRAMLNKYSLNSLFRPGVYVIPMDYVEAVDVNLQSALNELKTVREQLVTEWSDVIDDAKERLGEMFNPNDYPSPESAAQEFDMTYRYVPIAQTPTVLQNLAADIYKADLERTKVETEKELEAFRAHLRVTLLEIVDNMRKTLTKPDDSKRVFGQRFFKRLDEFLETFDVKNLSDDNDLKDIVDSLKKVATGADVKQLKESSDVQAALDTKLKDITHSMCSMLIEDDTRVIDLD